MSASEKSQTFVEVKVKIRFSLDQYVILPDTVSLWTTDDFRLTNHLVPNHRICINVDIDVITDLIYVYVIIKDKISYTYQVCK